MFKRNFFIASFALLMLFGVAPHLAKALNGQPVPPQPANNGQQINGNSNQANNGSTVQEIYPIDQPVKADISGLLQRTVNILLGLIAGVSVLFIMVGGFRLAFSQGKTEAVESGKKTITWAIIGLIVALMAFAIIRIVLSILY